MGPDSVPVLVVTGFLGSGKTTLINRILTARGGPRTAVVVNEFGDVPIDGRLVVAADEEVVELASGCICCTVRGDLARGLAGLLARRRRRLFRGEPFERIAIETSGLASPGPVVQTLLLEPELSEATTPANVVTLVHAALAERQLAEHPEVEEQVGYADRLIVNHADRASANELAAVEAALRARNALARIVRATRAEVDVADAFEPAGGPARWRERAGGDAPLGHAHTERAGAVVLRSRAPLDIHALKMWLQFLASNRSHDLWRVKGVLACRTLPNEVVVQAVHQFLELGPGQGAPPDESVLVLIGRDLDRAALERGWRSAGGDTTRA